MCEDLIEAYRENYGLKVSVLRFFNVFGPDGDQSRPNPPLLNFVYRELNKDQAPVLSGDGEQVRDFICIDDVVSMIDKCIEKKPDDVFNVCTGKAISVNQISKWVAEELGKEHIGLEHKEAEELWDRYPILFGGKFPLNKEIVGKETTRYSKGSYQKAKDLLGWEPNLDIESEVKRVVREIKIKEDKRKLIKDKENALAKAEEAIERADRLVKLTESNNKKLDEANKIIQGQSLLFKILYKIFGKKV
jgi:UDP-glucose 4-epimerase